MKRPVRSDDGTYHLDGKKYKEQITFIKDRPGHDKRYAINAGKIEQDLAWKPEESIQSGFRKTVLWYLDNLEWVENISSGEYQNWLKNVKNFLV